MRPGTRCYDVVYGATLLAFLAVYLWVHRLAGLHFPVPWPDEGSFLWQAIAVQERNTLFAPQLNPDRIVMWMPPGYMIWSGCIFKLTGFSLPWARTLSALYVMGGTVILAGILRRYRYPYLYLVLCGWFLVSRDFVITGNFARMEALVFLMAMGAFALLQRERPYPALALIGLTPLVHPNGLYFCAGAAVYAAVVARRRPERRRPSAPDVAAIAPCLAAWAAYAVFVARHWADFASDMAFQTSWRGSFSDEGVGFWDLLLRPQTLVPCAVAVAAIVYGVRKRVASSWLLALAIPVALLTLTTTGSMYEIYGALLVILASIVWVEMGMRMAEDASAGRSRALSVFLSALVFAGALALLLGSGRLESPVGYPYRMSFEGMKVRAEVPYFGDADARVVRRFLRSLESGGSPVAVEFLPWADALLFRDRESETVHFVQPTFHDGAADVRVVHRSRHLPPKLRRMMKLRLVFGGGSDADRDRGRLIHERDRSEKWIAVGSGVGVP